MKVCTKCKVEKDKDEFYFYATGKECIYCYLKIEEKIKVSKIIINKYQYERWNTKRLDAEYELTKKLLPLRDRHREIAQIDECLFCGLVNPIEYFKTYGRYQIGGWREGGFYPQIIQCKECKERGEAECEERMKYEAAHKEWMHARALLTARTGYGMSLFDNYPELIQMKVISVKIKNALKKLKHYDNKDQNPARCNSGI